MKEAVRRASLGGSQVVKVPMDWARQSVAPIQRLIGDPSQAGAKNFVSESKEHTTHHLLDQNDL